jgi:hypothetical protein
MGVLEQLAKPAFDAAMSKADAREPLNHSRLAIIPAKRFSTAKLVKRGF